MSDGPFSMETAPRDGTPILGWANGEFATVRWYPPNDETGWWSLCVAGKHAEDCEWEPAEWYHLPKREKEA